jgi:prophage regulatory protein
MSISEIPIATLELLKRRYVESLTGLSRSSIYKQISIGKFPSPVKLTNKSVAWRKEDVAAWIASRNSTPKAGATND